MAPRNGTIHFPNCVSPVAHNYILQERGILEENGQPCNFVKAEKTQKDRQYVEKHKPLFIIGSPACDQWSIMQNLNNGKRDSEDASRRMIESNIHVDFCAELYQMQINAGR